MLSIAFANILFLLGPMTDNLSAMSPNLAVQTVLVMALAGCTLACSACSTATTPASAPAAVEETPLPAWYTATRVQAHTRLAPPSEYCNNSTGSWTCSDTYQHAGARFASMGVRAYVRHTHQGTDRTYWPRGPEEAWEPLVRDTHRNLAQEMIDEAHGSGVCLIGYHYPKCHAYWSKAQPEW